MTYNDKMQINIKSIIFPAKKGYFGNIEKKDCYWGVGVGLFGGRGIPI